MQEAGPGTSSVVSSLDPDSLTYTVQHQVLGSDQWTALVTGLREPAWAATGLKKGLRHIFRVLSTSGKSSSKPSAPSEPVQLVEHGEPDAVGVGGRGVSDRLKGCSRLGDYGVDGVARQDPIPSGAAVVWVQS